MCDHIVYTGDIKIPLSADDLAMECGWRMVPVPPTADEGWIIADSRSDKKTGWMRRSALGEAGLLRH
jgi:hypothetical protein